MTLLRSLLSSKKPDSSNNARDSKDRDKDQNRNVQDPAAQAAGGGEFAQAGQNLQRMIGNQAVQRRARSGKKDSSSSTVDNSAQLAAMQAKLDAERNNLLPMIAEAEYGRMVSDAIRKTTEFAALDKSTAGVREALKELAVRKVTENIDRTDYTEQQKADAKKYAAEHVERQVVVPRTLYRYADQLVRRSVSPKIQQKEIYQAAWSGYQEVKPNAALPPDKHVEDAANRARRKARAEADRLSELLYKQNQERVLSVAKGDMSAIAQHLDVSEDLGVSEVEKRHELEHQLVDEVTVHNVYRHDLFEPLKQAVANKLTVGRSFWQRKSKEAKEFRKQMKDAGRAQAREDIEKQVNQSSNFTNDTEKEFHRMIAGVHAHKLAKGSVDKALVNEAEAIVHRVIPRADVKKELRQAAKSSAYEIARANPQDYQAIRDKALTGARARAAAILKDAKVKAVNEARKIYKGDKFGRNSQPDMSKQGDLIKSVREQVTKDDVAGAAIRQAIEEPNLDSCFRKISKILDLAAPNPGDSASYEFEVKVPIQGGAYVLFGLAGEVEKDSDEFTVSSQFTFGAGWSGLGIDANLRVGFYLEAKGKNSVAALNLVSYGLYREIRRLNNSAADFLWGFGGKSGMKEREEAELWAAMVEQKYMGDEGYVDIGLLTQAKAGVNAGVLEGEANIGAKFLNRFDKEAIERLSPGSFGKVSDDKAGNIGGGNTRFVLEGGAETEAEINGTKVGFAAEGQLGFVNWKVRDLEVSVQASLPFAYGEETSEAAVILAKYVVPCLNAVKTVVSTLKKAVSKDPNLKSNKKTSSVGGAVSALASLNLLIPQFDNIGKELVSKIQGEEVINNVVRGWFTGEQFDQNVVTEIVNKIGLSNSLDAEFSFGFEWDKDTGKLEKKEISLEIGQTKSFEIEAGVINFTAEKTSRLGKLSFGTEGFEFNFLGLGND